MPRVDWPWGEFKRHPDGTYSHQCGAVISRSGRLWISKRADGATEQQHSSLREAARYLYSHDPACWAHAPGFGSFQPSGRRLNASGGLMLETGELDLGRVFRARTCERFPAEPFAVRYLARKAFGVAICTKCSLPMAEFRLRKMPYVVDRVSDYPFSPPRDFRAWWYSPSLDDEALNDPSLAWAFVVCECGHPIWYHPEAMKLSYELDRAQIAATRNQRIRDAEGYYTEDDIQRLLKAQDGRCAYCRDVFTKELKVTVDHIVSLASGGTHWPSNICLACPVCNSKKGTMS